MTLIPNEEHTTAPTGWPIQMRAARWPELVQELRERFPDLARQVLTDSDEVVAGFVLVVNDEVMARGKPSIRLGPEDEVCLLAAIAGGCA